MVVRTLFTAALCCLISFQAISLEALKIKAEPYADQSKRIGQLAFFKTYQTSFKSSGNITQLAIEEGQLFKKGDVLAKVDTDDLSSELNQVIAEKAFVNKEIERLTKLKKVNAVSQSELDRLKSQSSQLRAQIIRTREFLDAAHIVANFDGVVISRLVDAGEFVSAGQPVLDLAPLVDNVVVEVAVQDKLLTFLNVGQEVQLRNTQSQAELTGKVKTLAQVPDKDTGLFIVKIAVLDDAKVRVGTLYEVTITQQIELAYAIPSDYAQLDFNSTAILLVEQNGQTKPVRFDVVSHDYQTIYVSATSNSISSDGQAITIHKAN